MPEETPRQHHPVLVLLVSVIVLLLIGVVVVRQYQASLRPKPTDTDLLEAMAGTTVPGQTDTQAAERAIERAVGPMVPGSTDTAEIERRLRQPQ